jgi:hypothetical protein
MMTPLNTFQTSSRNFYFLSFLRSQRIAIIANREMEYPNIPKCTIIGP